MCVHEQVNEAAEIIYDLVDQNANLIFGAVVDPACDKEVSPILVYTSFKGTQFVRGSWPDLKSQLSQIKRKHNLSGTFLSWCFSHLDVSCEAVIHCVSVPMGHAITDCVQADTF